jgi:hypothetical protein
VQLAFSPNGSGAAVLPFKSTVPSFVSTADRGASSGKQD